MKSLSSFTKRQKTDFSIGIESGFLLLLFWGAWCFERRYAERADFLLQSRHSLILLHFNAMLDLNNKAVFQIWALWGLFLFGTSIAGRGRPEFLITRTIQPDTLLT